MASSVGLSVRHHTSANAPNECVAPVVINPTEAGYLFRLTSFSLLFLSNFFSCVDIVAVRVYDENNRSEETWRTSSPISHHQWPVAVWTGRARQFYPYFQSTCLTARLFTNTEERQVFLYAKEVKALWETTFLMVHVSSWLHHSRPNSPLRTKDIL